MSEIKSYIIDALFNAYPQYLVGFRKNKGINIIDFWLPNDWSFPVQAEQRYQVRKEREEETMSYWIIFSDQLAHTELYDLLAYGFEYNLDIEKKSDLFKQKVEELKRLFTTLSYDELAILQFDPPKVESSEDLKEEPMEIESEEKS